MSNKEPKRLECVRCGNTNKKTRKIRFPGITFLVCYKCGGKLKEREDWLVWYSKMREDHVFEFLRGKKDEGTTSQP